MNTKDERNYLKNLKDSAVKIVGKAGSSISEGTQTIIDTIKTPPIDMLYIHERNNLIKEIIKETNEKIEPIKKEINEKLEKFGKVKLDILGTTINEFTEHMDNMKNLPYAKSKEVDSRDEFIFSEENLANLKVSIIDVKTLAKEGTLVTAGGILTATAAYTAVAAFGTASTGAVITGLTGIAASNATMAWLGGGAIAAGGGGMAAGVIVLGGIAIAPAIVYLAWKGKLDYSKERVEADEHYMEAVNYAESIDEIIKNFQELNRLVDNTILLINKYSIECNKLNKQTNHIQNQIGTDYEKYTDEQKELIRKHIMYTTKLLKLINTPVMNEDGSFNNEMINTLKESDEFLYDAKEIKFITYEKRKNIWTYFSPVIFVLVLGSYFYYKYYYVLD